MRAVCWTGRHQVEVRDVPDPVIIDGRDAIVRVTSTAICGSDLHMYDGYIPSMRAGDILGHEFMGEVVEVGNEVKNLRPGDRVVVPFAIACGDCAPCRRSEFSLCENTNPSTRALAGLNGFTSAGLFGYSHLYGGYAGGQAEYVRVPYADVGPHVVPGGLRDEQVLFLTDIFPTGYMAAENCAIKPGDVVAIWGAGPVGLFAALSASMLGAERTIVIDRVPERLCMAREHCHAETINFDETEDVVEALKEMTGGRGPDAVIDAVGMEAHPSGLSGLYDKAKQTVRMQTDRPTALRQAIQACSPGGVVSIPGVYAGFIDSMPLGAAFAKGLTFRMGQTHVHRYVRPLMREIEAGNVDPGFLVTHRLPLASAPDAYRTFRDKQDGCIKVVLDPAA
ncbi:MAG TPA: zinc-dependent alcohol dehydrogenase [Tepidiformaceae bacterium]|nr:zinc-dependent alcohol dehydrogenase [Tepidiformaceae bacterium]